MFSYQRLPGFVGLILLCLIFLPTNSFAEDIKFEVTVDRNKVALGEMIQLNLNFYGTQNVSTPYFPDIDGFSWQYSGSSVKMSNVNTRVSSSITHGYKLIPLKAGTLRIPSFSVNYRAKTYTSEPIIIEVASAGAGAAGGRQGQAYQGKIGDLENRAFIVMQAGKKKAYVNEIIPLSIKLYVSDFALGDIQYPQVSHEGFSLGEFSGPKRYRENLKGISYDVMEFDTDVFAMRSGELNLGPAELKCNLLVREKTRRPRSSFFDSNLFGSFFGRYQKYPLTLKSVNLPIKIMKLPEENMPDDFAGAMGNYSLRLEASPKEVKVGDPITLKMAISGRGNFKTVSPPALNFNKDDFKVYEPQIERGETSRTFEQVIIPKNDNIKEIPEVNFSFFDNNTGKYKRITKGPISIKVNPLPKGEQLKIFEFSQAGRGAVRKREILGRDIVYIKEAPGRLMKKSRLLCKNRLFIAIQFIPLLAIISALILQRRKERLQTDIRYARRLRAQALAKKNLIKLQHLLRSKEPDKFFSAVFKTLQEYLGDKFHLPTAGITSDVVEELKSHNVAPEILDKLSRCFGNCDMVRYAPSSITEEQMLDTFKLLEEIIDDLERVRV